jgi:hypothetical protein
MSAVATIIIGLFVAAVAVVIGLLALVYAMTQMDGYRVKKVSKHLFLNLTRRPKIKAGTSYGWPTFIVSFASRDDFQQAKSVGDNDAFLRAVQELFAHKTQPRGTRAKPRIVKFVAEYAVTFRYPGFEAELAAESREQVQDASRHQGVQDSLRR